MEIEACTCITKATSKYNKYNRIEIQILHNTLYSCSAH